jgi:hypothetical protein
MELILLRPDQIVGMIDYPPLHSPKALAIYFRKFCADEQDISPVPVIKKDRVLNYFRLQRDRFASYSQILQKFLDEHPALEYFMLDGGHRCAAAMLSGKMIPCLNITDDTVFREVNTAESQIKLHGDFSTLPDDMTSIDQEIKMLEEHFFENRRFWTVEEKVRAMIENGDIPEHMLKRFVGPK